MSTAAYGWVVEVDHAHTRDEADDSRVGTMGPRDIPDELAERLRAGEGRQWRTAYAPDHKGHPVEERLVHEGRMVYVLPDELGAGSDEDFAPLDDLSKPDCGADVIQWLNTDTGEWETL